MRFPKLLAWAGAVLLGVSAARADVLVDWNLSTVSDPNAPNYVNNAAFTGVASTVATVASGLVVSNLVSGSSSAIYTGLVWSTGNPGANQLNLQRWDFPSDTNSTTTGAGNGVPNNWLQFTLTAANGDYTVTTINFSAWRNGSGAPATWQFQYSTDSGSTWTNFGSAHTESAYGDSTYRSVQFTGSVKAATLLIRFIAIGPTGGTGNLHINQLSLEGSTTAQPTPTPTPTPTPVPTPAPVQISPAQGAIKAGQAITLTTETAGAEIRYTLDQSPPTESSTLYGSPFTLSASGEVRAKAFKDSAGSEETAAFFALVPVQPPKVLIILGDQIGFGDLSGFGSVGIYTPSLDRLVREGLRFNEATTTGPGLTASPYAILTGRSPRRANLAETIAADTAGIDDREWTLAEALRKQGYATAFIGAWELGSTDDSLPDAQGFQLFYGLPWAWSLSPTPPLLENNTVIAGSADAATLLDTLTSRAESFLDGHASEPFFLVFQPPVLAASGSSILGGDGTGNRIEAFDAAVGRLLDRLDTLGVADDTLVLYFSTTTADRSTRTSSIGSNGILRDGAGTTWEGGVRIPAAARWPGVVPAGVQSYATLWLPDVYSSLVGITGAWQPADRPYDGTSRPEILLGARTGATSDISIYLERLAGGSYAVQAVRQGAWKLHLAYQNSDPENTLSTAAPLLYNIEVDPTERINLQSSYTTLVSTLKGLNTAREATFGSGVKQLPDAEPPFLDRPVIQPGSGGYSVNFTRPFQSLEDHYHLEVSEDLADWTTLSPGDYLSATVSTADHTEENVTLQIPAGSDLADRPRLFFRLRHQSR